MEELWWEKYRPQKIKDIVLPGRIRKIFTSAIDTKTIPNFLLVGSAGCGKTTVARALCNEINAEYLFINGSDERNIDTLRGKIRNFASKTSFEGKPKIVIIDESDYLNAQSTQPALRAFIEEFHDNCRFILTGNFKNKIIEPLQSRCTVVEFTFSHKEELDMMETFIKKVAIPILKLENVEYDQNKLFELILDKAPDWRQILLVLQSGNFEDHHDKLLLKELVNALKKKDYTMIRKAIAELHDIDTPSLLTNLYKETEKQLHPECIPEIIITMNEYQFKDSFVADRELNKMACMAQLLGEMKWKD